MNSDLMPSSPEPSNLSASKQDSPITEAPIPVNIETTEASKPEDLSLLSQDTAADGDLPNRQQPIPPPSEPMQYRAIGLVRGRYISSDEQFTQGVLLTADGVELNSVLLGRIMSLVKNHLDLEKEHLWVVYPRTRQENDSLHIQIVGVWEPENLAKNSPDEQNVESQPPEPDISGSIDGSPVPSSEITDGGFSVRGEVVYQSTDVQNLVVKIKQAPRKPTDKPKYFKLKLRGILNTKAVGKFWDFQVKREADILIVESASAIADLPKKRRPPMRGGPGAGGRRPGGPGGPGGSGGRRPSYPPRRSGDTPPRPIKKTDGDSSASSRPVQSRPTPKPVKKSKPPEE
jgi:hypothetical protein